MGRLWEYFFCCLLWIFNPEVVVNFPIFCFYFYRSYYWHTWIDILHICMCPVFHFQMFIQRLNHLSTWRQHHLLGFRYSNPGRCSPELTLPNQTMSCKLKITGEKQFTEFMYPDRLFNSWTVCIKMRQIQRWHDCVSDIEAAFFPSYFCVLVSVTQVETKHCVVMNIAERKGVSTGVCFQIQQLKSKMKISFLFIH